MEGTANSVSKSAQQTASEIKNGDTQPNAAIKLPFQWHDGMHLPPFPKVADYREQLEEIRNISLHDSDIFLCTFPKSGTNWIYEVLTMLLEGSADYAKSNKANQMLEAINVNEDLATAGAYRILNTHVPFRHLPTQHSTKGVKIVHVARNPKDVFVSMYNHLIKSNMASDEFPGKWDNFINGVTKGHFKPYGGWCTYILDFEREQPNNPNIFTLIYEDMKKNPVVEIKRLASFLEVTCTKDFIETVADKTTFSKMAAAITESNRDKEMFKLMAKDGATNFILRKGEVGDWKNWFTVSQNERFDAMLDREMKDSKIQWQYNI